MDLIPAGSAPGRQDDIAATPPEPARVVLFTPGGHAVDVTDAAMSLLWLARPRPPCTRSGAGEGSAACSAREACPADIALLCRHLKQCGCERAPPASAEVPPSGASARLAVTIAAPPGAPRLGAWPGLSFEPGLDARHVAVTDALQLRDHLSIHPPQVLMLDARLLDLPGLGTAAGLGGPGPAPPVILLSDGVEADPVSVALCHRLDGVLPMRCPLHTCLRAIRAVARGDLWLPRRALAIAAARRARGAWPGAAQGWELPTPQTADRPLTGREAEIVQLLHGGLSNKEIARRLGIQEDTVKKHLLHVFAKLGVHRRAMVVLGGAASDAPTR